MARRGAGVLVALALVAGGGVAHAAEDACFVRASSSERGWLDFSGDRLRGGKGRTGERFSLARAPDGTRAVQHSIRRGDVVDPLGADTGFLYRGPTSVIRLSYREWTESGKGRGQPGKAMAIMMGRGQAGGHYQAGPVGNRLTGGEGASYYLLKPVTQGSAGTTSARNGLRGAIGAANRAELGAHCAPLRSNRPGGDPTNGDRRRCYERLHGTSSTLPTGEWVDVEMTVVMNDPGRANGSASYAVNGRTIHTQTGVMWMRSPEANPEVWVRWRMMYGGTPSELPPPQDVREWYKDFSLDVVPRGAGGAGGAGGDCVPRAPVVTAAPARAASSPVVASSVVRPPAVPARAVPVVRPPAARSPSARSPSARSPSAAASPAVSCEGLVGAGGNGRSGLPPTFRADPPHACPIWLCLGQIHIPECQAAQAESFRRAVRGKKPVIPFGSCDSEGDDRGFETQTVTAARIGNDKPMRFHLRRECRWKEDATTRGTTSPAGCTETYKLTEVFCHGRKAYPTHMVMTKGAPW